MGVVNSRPVAHDQTTTEQFYKFKLKLSSSTNSNYKYKVNRSFWWRGLDRSRSRVKMWTFVFGLLASVSVVISAPVEVPTDVLEGLPNIVPFQPNQIKGEVIPVYLGERRCDNLYHGEIPPCLLRPWLPPYSYSTTESYNAEWRKK